MLQIFINPHGFGYQGFVAVRQRLVFEVSNDLDQLRLGYQAPPGAGFKEEFFQDFMQKFKFLGCSYDFMTFLLPQDLQIWWLTRFEKGVNEPRSEAWSFFGPKKDRTGGEPNIWQVIEVMIYSFYIV